MIVVVGGISLLAFFAMPAVRMLLRSFESEGGTRSMIQAALSSARAIATSEQRYAGIRFQVRRDSNTPYEGRQYMIFIIHDYDGTKLLNGFRAVDGLNPIILPQSIGVMDTLLGSATPLPDVSVFDFDEPWQLSDTMSFSIVFSPTGKLARHDVQIRNRNGRTNNTSEDDIFNTGANVRRGIGMFIQDDYAILGLDKELSRIGFIMIDRREFDLMSNADRLNYVDMLANDQMNYVNAYTGRIIRGGR
jgi:hypothetical protein